jgi:hypothetical protein
MAETSSRLPRDAPITSDNNRESPTFVVCQGRHLLEATLWRAYIPGGKWPAFSSDRGAALETSIVFVLQAARSGSNSSEHPVRAITVAAMMMPNEMSF